MKIVHHSNQLGMGGTEKCMQYLLEYLKGAGHDCYCMHNRRATEASGGYREALISETLGAGRVISYGSEEEFFSLLSSIRPDTFHAHRSGRPEFPLVPRIREFTSRIVETNVFGGRDPDGPIDMTLYVNRYLRSSGRWIMRLKHVLYNPVKRPTCGRDLRGVLGIQPGTFVMGRIGRPDDHIFDPISLQALKELEAAGLEDILYLAQSPPPLMVRAAAEMGLKRIMFLKRPVVRDEEISAFYNTLDVLAHSRRDGETFGLNIAEAMIHGKPVVSHFSRFANGHAGFVHVCGFLAQADDHTAYAGYLRRLYDDRDLAARLGARGRGYAEENFLLEKLGAELEVFYSELWSAAPAWRKLGWLV
jgi:glycosyltransferase involved in cell wall biosynthesis